MSQMYPILLAVHNILRWVVLILAAVALVRAYLGWFGKRDWTSLDRIVSVSFISAMDTQVLLGLLLYFFFSPLTRGVFQDFREAMTNPEVRFFTVEHFLYMIVALILIHVGGSRAKRAVREVEKHRQSAIWFSLAVLLIALAIPWNRPLLPGIG